MATLLQVPSVALLTWQPGEAIARVSATAISDRRFQAQVGAEINLKVDPLAQAALQQTKAVSIDYEQLTAETRRWLYGKRIGRVLAVGLKTAATHAPSGILIVADAPERLWLDRQVKTLEILCSQLAWARRLVMLTEALDHHRERLEQLNWYKHQQLENLHDMLTQQTDQLVELSHQKDAPSSMRYQQAVRELNSLLVATKPLLLEERWQMVARDGALPLVTLLKRVVEQVEPIVKARQLWVQVHHESQALCIGSDAQKIELVLQDVVTIACQRSPKGGRLDIWCRPLDFHWLEISLTDYGKVSPALLQALANGNGSDVLLASVLDKPPGLHLSICQSLMQQLGGNFTLTQIEDGRTLSRLVVPIAATGTAVPMGKGS